MRLLIVHPENTYFAGAERMLGYFLDELAVQQPCETALALSPGSRLAGLVGSSQRTVTLAGGRRFSPIQLWRQARTLQKFRRQFPFDLVHGWTARDWELAWATGRLCGCPAIGTLHDHPNATFISAPRQWLMRCCARRGLHRIACVSSAVKLACEQAAYPRHKLAVIHNGLPAAESGTAAGDGSDPGPLRLGFLGVFSERKGLRGLFRILDGLSAISPLRWELHLGGKAQDDAGQRLMAELSRQNAEKTWWPRIHWHGWVESPPEFLRTLDLLILPSSEFDPFPTVLLEAGQAGVPVLAARVGGVAEIITDGQTGWLFEPDNWPAAAQLLGRLLAQPDLLVSFGQQARRRVDQEFSAAKMVAEYMRLYSTLLTND